VKPRIIVALMLGVVVLLAVNAELARRAKLASGSFEQVVPEIPEPATNPPERAGKDEPRVEPVTQRVHAQVPQTGYADSPEAWDAPGKDVATDESPYVIVKRHELYTLAMRDDTIARDVILSEMQNPNKMVRKYALEAAVQFGDRSVIPALEQLVDQMDDPRERVDILDAIEYIGLPSLTEYLEEQKAASASKDSLKSGMMSHSSGSGQ
jgi:hypothetical protein